jgi:long-chain acyl-CoA synthetase
MALLKRGYGFKSMIGIFSNNRPEWSIADYGILGIRGVTVPFFGTATKEQVKYIVDETAMKLIFVGNKDQFEKAFWLFDHCPSLETIVYFGAEKLNDDDRCIRWEEFLSGVNEETMEKNLEALQEEAGPDDLATILYTSGTTGEPKGVMLTHDNFMSCFEIHKERLDVNKNDVSLCFLPLSHVFERTWSYYMMYCGVENVFLENPREVINELPVANPTVMCVVPRFFEKTYEGIMKEFNGWPTYKQRIFNWSVKTGHQFSEYSAGNKKAPLLLSVKRKVADRLVLKKL